MEHTISHQDGLLVIHGAGETSAEGFFAVIDDIIAELGSSGGSCVLVDLGEASARRLKMQDIRRISEETRKLSSILDGGRLALLLRNDLEYGLARMWQSFTEPRIEFEVQVFRAREKAECWLRG